MMPSEIALEFNDMFPDYPLAKRIAQAFQHNAIKRKENILELPKIIQFSLPILFTKRGTESLKHKYLKQIAYDKLKQLGEPNPKVEFYYGGYFDLYAEKLGISVECGRTNLWSLWEFLHFSEDIDREFWLVKYPDKNGEVKLIRFLHTERTKEFVEKIDRQVMRKMAKIMAGEAREMEEAEA